MASGRKKMSRFWSPDSKLDISIEQAEMSRHSEDSGYGSMVAECGVSAMPNTFPFKNTIRKAASTTFQVFSNSLRTKTELFYSSSAIQDPQSWTPDGSPPKKRKLGTPIWASVRRRAQLDNGRPLVEAITPDGVDILFERPRSSHVESAPMADLSLRTKPPSPKELSQPCTDIPHEIEMDIPKSGLIELQDPWLAQVGRSRSGSDDSASDLERHDRRHSDFSMLSQSTQATEHTRTSRKGHSLFVTGRRMNSQRTASPYRLAKKEPRNTVIEALSITPWTGSQMGSDMACASQLPQCDTPEDDMDGSTDPDDDKDPNLALERVQCNNRDTPGPLVVPDPTQRLSADSMDDFYADDEVTVASGDGVIGPKDPTWRGQRSQETLSYGAKAKEQQLDLSSDSVPNDENTAASRSVRVPDYSKQALGSEEVFDKVPSKTTTIKEVLKIAPLHRPNVDRSMSACSDATTASCAVTTHSLQCDALPPTPMHHRASPARSASVVLRDFKPVLIEGGYSSSGTDMDAQQSSPKASTSAATAMKIICEGEPRRDSTNDRTRIRKRSWRMRDSRGQDITYDAVGSTRDACERTVCNGQKRSIQWDLEGTWASSPSRRYPIRNPSRYRNGEDRKLLKQGADLETDASGHSHQDAASQAYADMVRDELDRLQIAHGP